MVRRLFVSRVACYAGVLSLCLSAWGFAQKPATPGAETILGGYRPAHAVDIDTPDKADWGKCKVDLTSIGKGNGFVVTGPQGQVIRRFLDVDGNQSIDQYRYYKDGIEVYRELDTTGNKAAVTIDQYRWLNTGGTRWGTDTNKDGVIDKWTVISAEEVSMEAVRALVTGDPRILKPLLVTSEDLTAAGVDKTAAANTLKGVANAEKVLSDIRQQSKLLKPTTKWLQFNCAMPYMIPAEAGRSTQDLYVYENAIAIVQNGADTGSVHLGEILRIGNTWRLTVMPRPVEGEDSFVAEGGSLFQHNATTPTTANADTSGGLKPEVQELLEAIQKLDQGQPGAGATAADVEKYHNTRFQYMARLVEASDTPDEKDSWRRQLIEGIFAATQIGAYANGLAELTRMETAYSKTPKDPIYPFIIFRRLLTAYSLDLQSAAEADRQKIQESLLKSLEEFSSQFPKADDRPDALLQLAITHDLSARAPEAAKWYQMILADHPESRIAARAKGSLARLSLKGKKLSLAGPLLSGGAYDPAVHRGKVLVVTYWSTYCGPCTQDLPSLIELYKAQQASGFEVQGVCLDNPGGPIQEYLQQHKVPWSHIHDNGGMEGDAALTYGIVALPTMLIVDRTGVVVAITTSMADVKKLVPDLLKK